MLLAGNQTMAYITAGFMGLASALGAMLAPLLVMCSLIVKITVVHLVLHRVHFKSA